MYDFTILVLPGANAASVAVTLDVLAAAAALAARSGAPAPRWRVFCAGGAPAALSNGMAVNGQALPNAARTDKSIWIVPGLGVTGARSIAARLAKPDACLAAQALHAHARRGGVIAASCSAVFLLQEAGLLTGKHVTTAWWMAGLLHQREPACTVDADRMVIEDGNIISGGAAMAQTDLMLHLLRTRFGIALADAVARLLVVDGRQAQAPFIVPQMLAMGNELIARIADYVEKALPRMPSIEEIAERFCVSERTLARHVKTATGRSPLALLQSLRLNKARSLLENSKLSVGEIAAQVGYADATALRRLMRKATGATPGQFRGLRAQTTHARRPSPGPGGP